MSQNIEWTFSADSAGGGLNTSGSSASQAVITAGIELDAAMANQSNLSLQVDNVGKIAFLAITSSLYDGKVEIQATNANATAMTGPLILYGSAVSLFATDLTTLKVQNKSANMTAKLSILIGLQVAP